MSTRSFRYSTLVQHFGKGRMASTDRDALAFIEAAGIYNTNQQKAIVDLVRGLKRTGLWTKMKAIYPFIGGTATSHKWNLKDPRDVDAAFRLNFVGGWTHSSTGAKPNGTNAYGNTYVTPTANLTQNSTHFSFYSRTNSTNNGSDIAMYNPATSPAALFQLVMRYSDGSNNNLFSSAMYSTSDGCTQTNVTDGRFYGIASRTSSTSHKIYRNGVNTTTATTTAQSWSGNNRSLFISGRNNADTSTAPYSDKECAFATIGDGLTDSDATNLYNIVDLYQKRLGRAV